MNNNESDSSDDIKVAQAKFDEALDIIEELTEIVFNSINLSLDGDLSAIDLIRQSIEAIAAVEKMTPEELTVLTEEFEASNKGAAGTKLEEVDQRPESVISSGQSSSTGFDHSTVKKKEWVH